LVFNASWYFSISDFVLTMVSMLLIFRFVALYAHFDSFFISFHQIKLVSQLSKTLLDHALFIQKDKFVRDAQKDFQCWKTLSLKIRIKISFLRQPK